MSHRSRRGYALLFVLVMVIALGVIVGGLFAVLGQSVSSSKAAHADLQQLYGCDGAMRLAFSEAERYAGSTDDVALSRGLRELSVSLARDIDPRTSRPYADVTDIRVEPSAIGTFTATTLPFLLMEYVQESSRITIASDSGLSRGRSCRADSPTRRRSLSMFQFAAASSDDVRLGSVFVTGGSAGDVFVLQHRRPGARRTKTPAGPLNVHVVNLADNDAYTLPGPPTEPARFIRKWRNLFGWRRSTRYRRPTSENFLKLPTDARGPDPAASRFARGADLRIIDGDWYVNEAGAFPGRRIWSDQRAAPPTLLGRAYSSYERNSGGDSRGGAAVIRYGLVDARNRSPLVRGLCNNADALVPIVNVLGNQLPDCLLAGLLNLAPTGETDPFRRAAQVGFFDPSNNTPIFPIVVDVQQLRAAMSAPLAGDLGGERCVGPSTVVCSDARRFKGSVWIGTTALPGSVLPDGTARVPCSLQAGAGCMRPNAVVLYNADDLSAFVNGGESGLSIASNLPMYVVGDVNSRLPGAGSARVALLAPQITALPADFEMARAAWGTTTSLPTPTTTLNWNTSIFTGWATDLGSGLTRDPTRHVLRKLGGDLRINLVGSMVMPFERKHFDDLASFNWSRGGYNGSGGGDFSNPDPQVAGLPIFLPSSDAAEGTSSRLVSVNLRFPGDGARDLRRSPPHQQPPNAPRISLDLATLDRR